MTTVDEAWERLTRGETNSAPGDEASKAMFEAGWNALIEVCGGTEHYVRLTEYGDWTLQHPITERLQGALFDCKFPQLIEPIWRDLPPDQMVRVWLDRNALLWEPVE